MSVCAAFVTYEPILDDLRRSVEAVCMQVDATVLIDNASRPALHSGLRQVASGHGASFIQNEENLGIATALNQGIDFARRHGCTFIVFFDQDSEVNDVFIPSLLRCFDQEAGCGKIGLAGPKIINRITGRTHGPLANRAGTLILAQTSGALMPIEVFDQVGSFRDDFFIDYVDYEHCLRLTLKGWEISYAPDAQLTHMPGNNVPVRLVGKTFHALNASAPRQYYRVRNCIWVVTAYFRSSPALCLGLLASLARDSLKMLLLEDDKWQKSCARLTGLRDGLLRHMGKRLA